MCIRVLLPAGQIPVGRKVTKRGGEKIYTLKDRINIYSEQGERKTIVADEGTRFLVSQAGDANTVGASTKLLWSAEEWDLLNFLEDER